MPFKPKFHLLPHIQRQIKAIENTTGFLEAVRFREDWIQEVRAQTHVEDALASVQIEGSSVTLEQAFALSGQLPDRDLSDAEREFTNNRRVGGKVLRQELACRNGRCCLYGRFDLYH